MRTLPTNVIDLIERSLAGESGHADELAAAMKPLPPQQYHDCLVYWDSRQHGSSRLLAEMFALQSAPQPKTDATFFSGFGANGAQFAGGPMQEELGNRYKAEADAAGVNVKGRTYISGIARYPGDPRAWIADKHDAIKYLEETGRPCIGDINLKASSQLLERMAMHKEAPPKPYDGGIDNTEVNNGRPISLTTEQHEAATERKEPSIKWMPPEA